MKNKDFLIKLKNRPFEDIHLIGILEGYLKQSRGYTFRMPPPQTPIILLYSAGLDSTVAWAILIEKYRLQVYPLYITGYKSKSGQYVSLKYFQKYFKTRFPDYYHEPLIAHADYFTPEIRHITKDLKTVDPAELLNYFLPGARQLTYLSGLNSLTAFSGALYASALKLRHGINVNTIFSAVLSSDSIFVPAQSLTSIRIMNLFLNSFLGRIDIQLASIFFDNCIGSLFEKKDVIAIGSELDLPLEKTYSCYRGQDKHCGNCLACSSRRQEFMKAGVKDRTTYQDGFTVITGIRYLKSSMKSVMFKLLPNRREVS